MTQQSQRTTVNPTSLSLPAPAASVASPAPSASSSSTQQQPQNPRKRPRASDLSPEDKKEARAHRNRIAAQNSRDKRKLQFSSLEQRLRDLENENRQLRDAMSAAATSPTNLAFVSGGGASALSSEREQQRERENQELRERIKLLEQGWSSVVQALTAAGQAIPSLGLSPSLIANSSTSNNSKGPSTTTAVESVVSSSPAMIVLDDRQSTPALSPAAPADSTPSSPSLSLSSLATESMSVPKIVTSTRQLAAGGMFGDFDGAIGPGPDFDFTSHLLQEQSSPQGTAQVHSQADAHFIDAWLQDILHPIPTSPTSSTASATISGAPSSMDASSPFTVDIQETASQSELIKLESQSTLDDLSLSWILKTGEEVEQLLDLTLDQSCGDFDGVVDVDVGHLLEDLPWGPEGLPVF